MKLSHFAALCSAAVMSLASAQAPHPLVDLTFLPADNIQGYEYGPAAVQTDRKVVMGMAFYELRPDENGVPQWTHVDEMRRLHPDGTLDESFQPVRGRGPVVVAPNGDVIVASGAVYFGEPELLVRADRNGRILWSVEHPLERARGVLLQPDGKVIVYGWRGIRRYTAQGEPDYGFHAALPTSWEVWSAGIQRSGRIVLACYQGVAGARILRLDADGSEDASFFAHNRSYGSGQAMAVLPNDKILLGGGGGTEKDPQGVVRLNADGTRDTAFEPSPYAASAMTVQPDGKIVIGGYFLGATVNGRANPALLTRLLPDGPLDPEFGCPLCAYDNEDGQGVHELTIGPDGKVIATGSFFVPGTPLYGIVRLNTAPRVPLLQFTATAQDVRENAGLARVRVKRTGNTGVTCSAVWSTRGLTATPWQDFLPLAGMVVFLRGETERTILIPILPDRQRESTESIEVKLKWPSSDAELGTPQRMTLQILDAR